MSPKTLARIALSAMALSACSALWSLERFQRESEVEESAAATAPDLGRVPDFFLKAADARGATVLRGSDLLGRVWIADFIFTRSEGPGPILSANMARLQEKLPGRVWLVSFTVDPAHDTPPVLRRYAAQLGAQPGRWFFVTGPKPAVRHLILEGLKLPLTEYPQAPAATRVTHSTKFLLVDRLGRIRGAYDGLDEASLAGLIRDAGASLR